MVFLNSFLSTRNALCNDVTENVYKPILKIPYVGSISNDFKKNISNLINKKFKTDVRCVYTTFKVSNYFSLKSHKRQFSLDPRWFTNFHA